MVHLERLRPNAGRSADEPLHRPELPPEAGDGDMRQESALVRPDADAGERLVHLVVQDFQRCMGSDADPEVVGPSPPVKLADAVERDLEAAMVDSAKRCGDVLGPVPVHLADEAKSEMKLGFRSEEHTLNSSH